MRKVCRYLFTAIAGLGLMSTLGCDSRAHQTDSGGVMIVVSDFDGRPISASVSAAQAVGGVLIDNLTLQSNVLDPAGSTSTLMDVEIRTYEVTFTRADTGTRVPPSLVKQASFYVPAGGTAEIVNLAVMLSPQLTNVPLSDLANFGIDRETGSTSILLNVSVRFFGETIGGRELETSPFRFTVEFTQ